MSSSINNPATWSQQTQGGIRYRFLDLKGRFNEDESVFDWYAVFQSSDLINAMEELFPPPVIVGNISIPTPGRMPGLTQMVAREADFERMSGSDLPIDPFNAHPATAGTYGDLIKLHVVFGSEEKAEPDPNDPRTFLELTSSTGGQYLYVPPSSTEHAKQTNPNGKEDEKITDPVFEDRTSGKVKGEPITEETKPNKQPDLPTTILIPTTEWSVTWKQVNYELFRDFIVWRLRLCNGRVNDRPIPFLHNAPAETVLFSGFSYKQSYTWRANKVETPPVDVTLKFVEKHIIWQGVIIGWNHTFVPGTGWSYTWLSDGQPAYRRIDHNFMFRP